MPAAVAGAEEIRSPGGSERRRRKRRRKVTRRTMAATAPEAGWPPDSGRSRIACRGHPPLKARSLGFPKPYIRIPLSCSTPAMPEEDSGTPEAVFRCSRKLGVSETRDRRPSSESRRNTGISR
ncbi:hypothetical protein B296_00050822 [Ensete ventricosum]|uniref:Uncharacterized protein n=1 Tax=Ensete ventricosum TaxID=4639 RepID=A0A426XVF9_ENSVE|nr:hypothetical protein B296_00050822 [Ensete ventricosum]